ncbi:uncharacterized protein LOC107269204 [Cephus cinctus]|uniref:Uncharacterized protein LOC107269204 n=1 Tax=Cephus cinctus TaxID=211228 RepID=A0AAJ7C0H1_CEPCN|nr:uncharacterized protein LOC107269204 [Cephus cinctus]
MGTLMKVSSTTNVAWYIRHSPSPTLTSSPRVHSWCTFKTGMKLSILTVTLYLILSLTVGALAKAIPVGNPEAAIESMRQIPQWHCLRYRKFDLVRRCRNYRIGRKH